MRLRWLENENFASPIFPVLAALTIAATAASSCSSMMTISILTLGKKIHGIHCRVDCGVDLLAAEKPLTSLTVLHSMPTLPRAVLDFSSLNGFMIAFDFFIG